MKIEPSFLNHASPERRCPIKDDLFLALCFWLYQVAIFCYYCDLRRCLSIWIDVWAELHLGSYQVDGHESLRFGSFVFSYNGTCRRITRHLILTTQRSGNDLVTEEGFPPRIDYPRKSWVSLDTYASSGPLKCSTLADHIEQGRLDTIIQVQDLYWQAFCIVCARDQGRVCKISNQQAVCNAMNLGYFYQRLSEIDPRSVLQFGGHIVNSLAAFPSSILDRCSFKLF